MASRGALQPAVSTDDWQPATGHYLRRQTTAAEFVRASGLRSRIV